MPAYLVSTVCVSDPDRYMDYAKAANEAVAKYGGKFVLRGKPAEILEGTPSSNRLVVSEWPSLNAARAYYHSPEYAAAKTLRQGGVAEAEIMLFEGV